MPGSTFARLVRRGKDPQQFPTVVAKFAAQAAQNGRPIGHAYNRHELMNVAAFGGAKIESLESRGVAAEQPWKELLAERKAFLPPDVAAARLDIPA